MYRGADWKIVHVTDTIVFLIDMDLGGRSVTNDAEAVFASVQEAHPGKRVVYRDSMGRWDELVMERGGIGFVSFPYTQLPIME